MEWNDRSKKAQKRLGGKFIPITLIQGEVKGQFLCNCGQKEWPSPVSVRLEETINRGMGGWERRERERLGLGSADRTQRVPETLVTLSRQKAEGCRRHGGQALWALLVARWAQRTNSHSQWSGGAGPRGGVDDADWRVKGGWGGSVGLRLIDPGAAAQRYPGGRPGSLGWARLLLVHRCAPRP